MGDNIKALRDELERLRRRVEQRPLLVTGKGGTPYMFVLIEGGNTLDSGEDGVIFEDTTIASVPSAYDPNVTSTFIDGIGRGTLYVNGAAQSGYVLVVNDDRGVNRNAVLAGESPYAGSTVAIPVSGGGGATVTAYVIC